MSCSSKARFSAESCPIFRPTSLDNISFDGLLRADRVWSLWSRYACTAFYSHPWAWNEIGFPGPAYPRGYKNPGVNAREPFEVADHGPMEEGAQR